MNYPFIVNFFTQRDYERTSEMLKAGSTEIVSDPKTYGLNKR